MKDQIPRIVTDISKIKNHKDHSMKNKWLFSSLALSKVFQIVVNKLTEIITVVTQLSSPALFPAIDSFCCWICKQIWFKGIISPILKSSEPTSQQSQSLVTRCKGFYEIFYRRFCTPNVCNDCNNYCFHPSLSQKTIIFIFKVWKEARKFVKSNFTYDSTMLK